MPPQADKVTKSAIEQAKKALPELALEAAENDRGITITLKRPVEHGNVTWKTLEFQPMCGEHVENLPLGMAGATIGHLLEIGGRMAAVPPGVMSKLGPADVRKTCDVVNAFLLFTQSEDD